MGFFHSIFSSSRDNDVNVVRAEPSHDDTQSLDSMMASLYEMSQEIFKDVATPYEIETALRHVIEYVGPSQFPELEPMAFRKLCKGLAELTNKRISSSYVAREFILQELDGARLGNETAVLFAKNSCFSEHEYIGSLSNEDPRIDGAGGPQQFLNFFVAPLVTNMLGQDKNLKIRIGVVKEIMKMYGLGDY